MHLVSSILSSRSSQGSIEWRTYGNVRPMYRFWTRSWPFLCSHSQFGSVPLSLCPDSPSALGNWKYTAQWTQVKCMEVCIGLWTRLGHFVRHGSALCWLILGRKCAIVCHNQFHSFTILDPLTSDEQWHVSTSCSIWFSGLSPCRVSWVFQRWSLD